MNKLYHIFIFYDNKLGVKQLQRIDLAPENASLQIAPFYLFGNHVLVIQYSQHCQYSSVFFLRISQTINMFKISMTLLSKSHMAKMCRFCVIRYNGCYCMMCSLLLLLLLFWVICIWLLIVNKQRANSTL